MTVTTTYTKLIIPAGDHVLKVFGIDSSVVLDRIVIRFSREDEGYLGRPETYVRGSDYLSND